MTPASALSHRQHGYVLLAVMMALLLVAAVSLMLTQEEPRNIAAVAGATEAVKAGYLSKSGMAQALWLAKNGACLKVSADVTGRLDQDQYSFTLTPAAPSATTELATFYPDKDGWVDEEVADVNHGTASELQLKYEKDRHRHALFHYDLSSIAQQTEIASAIAWFYVTVNDAEDKITLHLATKDWAESTLTWSSNGLDYDASAVSFISPQSGPGWVGVNLTGVVRAWVDRPSLNRGLILAAHSDKVLTHIASREHANRPYLEVITTDGDVSVAELSAQGATQAGTTRSLGPVSSPLYQQPLTILLQPGPEAGMDSYINQDKPDENRGADSEVRTDSEETKRNRALIQFGQSGIIPANANLVSVELQLYLHDNSGLETDRVEAHALTRAWQEGDDSGGSGVSWDTYDGVNAWTNPGGDYDPEIIDSFVASGTGWKTLDLTSVAREWLSGERENHGIVLLTPSSTGNNEKKYYSSDHNAPELRPRLLVHYSCVCSGSCLIPSSSGRILIVVDNAADPKTEELQLKQRMQGWGYTAGFISDDADQGVFDSLLANHDVVYIATSADDAKVATKLTPTTLGLVSEDGTLNDELGLATDKDHPRGLGIDVLDNSHYITELFPLGDLTLKTEQQDMLTVKGTSAPGLQLLAEFGGAASLAVMDEGGELVDGSPAAGKRVMLPLGDNTKDNWKYLNEDGAILVQRAIEWAMGSRAACTDGNFRDEFTTGDYGGTNGTLVWTGDWIEVDASGLGSGVGKVRILTGEIRLQGTPAGDSPSLAREMDLTAYQSATLSFDFRTGSGVDTAADDAVVEISGNGGATWTLLEGFSNVGPDASGSRSHDIAPYIAANTQVRFRINAGYGGSNEYFYVDNLDIAAACTATPDSAGRLLMVAADPANLSAEDVAKKALIEGWGFTVSLIDDSDSQTAFDTAVAANDVVFISVSAIAGNVDTKLINASIGVVIEQRNLADEFDLINNNGQYDFTDLSITVDSHYITETLGLGTFTLFTSPQQGTYVAGGQTAPGMDFLATWGTTGTLGAIDAGGELLGGAPAPGRRVFLPWGGSNGLDPNLLTDAGKTILKRALEWGAGNGGGGSGTYLDEFNAVAYDGDDGTLPWSNDWQEFGESDGAATGRVRVLVAASQCAGGNCLRFGGDEVSLTGRGVSRQADLSGASTAELTFTVADSGSGASVRVEVSDNAGATWTTLQTFTIGSSIPSTPTPQSFDISAYASPDTQIRFIGSGSPDDAAYLYIDAVRIDVNGGGSGGGGGGGPGYNETYAQWSATTNDTWESVDLGAFGVPANAVVEVAVVNSNTGSQLWGGVRAVGSTLDRRLQLHEAESGGSDVMVMHVQADANGAIEHYSDTPSDVSFLLLGYWGSGSYQESWQSFGAGTGGSWADHALGGYGVPAASVVEVVLSNRASTSKYKAGVRSGGSGNDRFFEIHEAESGGVELLTLPANADTASRIQVYAESDASIDFYLAGYWSDPPGSYTESIEPIGKPSNSATWETRDLSAMGVPANAIANVVMFNAQSDREANLGVRAVGSSLLRTLDLQEAEGGGSDLAGAHVTLDAAGEIEWYDENTQSHEFWVVGWWELP